MQRLLKEAASWIALIGVLLFLQGCLTEAESDTDGSGFTDTTNSTPPGSTPPPGGNPPANSAPSISGSPKAGVLVGDVYRFRPNASDPDGDTLTFTVNGLPAWADFNESNGEISGQPTLGDVGVYENIRIRVSDGTNSTGLSAFSVTVSQVQLGAVTLEWTPPTLNTDGSQLTDLSGYKFYYGTASNRYTNSIRVDNPSISTYMLDNLAPDTYFIAATTFNSAGLESALSNEVVYSVN